MSADVLPPFVEFPKIARLSRNVIVTEKLDGTNAQVFIDEAGEKILAGSRNRWITPTDDNFVFARWVEENKTELLKLGPGAHFGEWWGSGIQRGYGLTKGEKRFSLFNVSRWRDGGKDVRPACCHVVPVLWEGVFESWRVDDVLVELRVHGSRAAPGFMKPEGVVVWHEAARQMFKKTIEKDEEPKGLRGAA